MKKSIIAAASALAGISVSAFAAPEQGETPEAESFSVGAKIAYETQYIDRGIERSDENVQTTIIAEYALAPMGDWGMTVYGEAFFMAPVKQEANKASLKLGLFTMYEDEYFIDVGYKYTGFPNRGKMDISYADYSLVKHEDEIFIGIGRDIEFVSDADWSIVRLFGYMIYDFEYEALTFEVGAEKGLNNIFDIEGLGVKGKIVYGYVNQEEADGKVGGQWFHKHYLKNDLHDDYGYFALSFDVSYSLTKNTDVFVGIRYAWNNDDNYDWMRPGTDNTNFWVGVGLNFRY